MEWPSNSASQLHCLAVLVDEGEQEFPAEDGVCKELSSSTGHLLAETIGEGEIKEG
jgi:hypothetical protein